MLFFVQFVKGLVCIFVCFCISLYHFDFVLPVLLNLLFSVPNQDIGWEERLRSDLFCVEWDVNPCSILLLVRYARNREWWPNRAWTCSGWHYSRLVAITWPALGQWWRTVQCCPRTMGYFSPRIVQFVIRWIGDITFHRAWHYDGCHIIFIRPKQLSIMKA